MFVRNSKRRVAIDHSCPLTNFPQAQCRILNSSSPGGVPATIVQPELLNRRESQRLRIQRCPYPLLLRRLNFFSFVVDRSYRPPTTFESSKPTTDARPPPLHTLLQGSSEQDQPQPEFGIESNIGRLTTFDFCCVTNNDANNNAGRTVRRRD